MSLLDERDLTGDERAAIADEPRPGVWIEEGGGSHFGENGGVSFTTTIGDGRTLSQHETDILIVTEMWNDLGRRDETRRLISQWLVPMTVGGPAHARHQRGGVHSDPLVRLFAYRTWGDRDRANDLAKLGKSLRHMSSITGSSLHAVVRDARKLGSVLDPLVAQYLELLERAC